MVKIARAVRYCALDVHGVRFQTFHVSDARIHLRQKCLAQVASRASVDIPLSLDIDHHNSCGASRRLFSCGLASGSAMHRISKNDSPKFVSHHTNSSRITH
jgi:hypothetical protein